MKTKSTLLLALLVVMSICATSLANQPAKTDIQAEYATPTYLKSLNVPQLLKRLRAECDKPNISHHSEWMYYASRTELVRTNCIVELASRDASTLAFVRREQLQAKGEYEQMLHIARVALGDASAQSGTAQLMLFARSPAVRFCAARQLQRLQNPNLIPTFREAMLDQFQRRDGACIGRGMIYPVRIVAAGALVSLGVPFDEVQNLQNEPANPVLSAQR